MRFSVVIALALPFLTSLTTALGQPIQSGSADLLSRYDDELSVRGLVDSLTDYELRSLSHYLDDALDARAGNAPYNVKQKKPKVTAAQQATRKSNARTNAAGNQAKNAVKKADLKKKAETAPKYGKPRSASKQKPNQPGYRAAGRAAGHRLPKQPKTPKPNMVKGQAPSAKAQKKQGEANARKTQRKADGRAKFAPTKEAYRKTTSLPHRKNTFTAPDGKKVSGKDVRTAVFNSHHFSGNKGGAGTASPKPFKNNLQGPAGSKTRPLPKMKGAGKEFPVNTKKGGYQGGGDVGSMRVVTQPKRDGGSSFKGVIGHDTTRKPSDPGFNDHFQVKSRKK